MKEHGCMYGLMNGANSDNAVSIQKMVTRNSLEGYPLEWLGGRILPPHDVGRGHAQIFLGKKEIVIFSTFALKTTMSGKI